MESWMVGVISLAMLMVVNAVLLAYSYGSLTTKVGELAKQVGGLTNGLKATDAIVLTATALNIRVFALEKVVDSLATTIHNCPTCNKWTGLLPKSS